MATETGNGTVVLFPIVISGAGVLVIANPDVTLTCLTPLIYSNGSAILVFQGPANVFLDWTISIGGGTITNFDQHSDSAGTGHAIYDADGYVGAVTVTVNYG